LRRRREFDGIGLRPKKSPKSDSVLVMMRQRPEDGRCSISRNDSARIRRDPAYDGRFFTGVRTTGIYCRLVCPVRPAQSKNVEYYPSAAAAEAAGYRPCLRCRPETAPFSPAWKGSLTTVERAMRLINEAALDGAGVDALAERLGIGARHLSRLFKKHVGASPSQVAQTARVQRAKRMIDNTDLAMTEIALAAGFGSLRRFNTAFAAVYKRPPTAIRRGGHAPMASAS
jgi:AraC family transcriptional regulator of adaptative response/methylated-DNA-[protein]-cysteine methyltransferase